jgi:hypothetical protein
VADFQPEEWLQRLQMTHDNELASLKMLNAYYEGVQPLSYMHPKLLETLGARLRAVIVNWPRLAADSVEERLDVEGFRLPAKEGAAPEEADGETWRVWQANDLDEWSQQAHVDAMVMRRSFAVVGSNADDENTPLVTVESPLQMYAEIDPRTRKPRAALKRWTERYLETNTSVLRDAAQYSDHATLYLPDRTIWYERDTGWKVIEEDVHNLGEVPVEPLVNRKRLMYPLGVSELVDVIPLSDAACKIATDMMVSAEFHAMPRRWALGFGEEDFTDEAGNAINPWEAVAGLIWRSEKSAKDDGVSVGQFPEADLRNFHETLNQLAKLVASLTGLPPHYLGFTTDNPASADAIRSAESRLVKRAERKQRGFGGSWERVARLVNRFQTGDWDPRFKQVETLWREASTPTFAQKSDAAQKLVASGIIPREAAWEDLGYSASRQARLQEMFDREDPVLQQLVRGATPPAAQPVPPGQAPNAPVAG